MGIEAGGAIGFVFYVSQAVSVTLYVMGFTEALLSVVPSLPASPRVIASLVNVGVFACVYIGAGWTIKLQKGIFVLLMLSVISFMVGALRLWDPQLLELNWVSSYEPGHNYWIMFALFFPAVTGIMAGANMSGDLENPGRSIPRGTLLSILFTTIIYLAFSVLLGASASREALQSNSMIVSTLALFPSLIIVGVFAATLSSALGSMMGAPRILQALARDKVLPFLTPFGKGSGPSGEPRRATVVSFFIAQTGIMLGDLNAVAPVITMFFMITYGAINLATFFEAFSGNPSYRPTFRWCHWSASLVGTILCGGVMVLINPLWAAAAVAIMLIIFYYLRRQKLESSWGDVVSGAMFERLRRNLLALEELQYHVKNWRPAVLVVGAGSTERLYIAAQGRRLAGPHGLLMLGQVLVGEPSELLERHAKVQRALRTLIADTHLEAFPCVTIAPELTSGISSLVQCAGVGALRPNLVLFGWSCEEEQRTAFEENLRTVVRLGRSMAILRCAEPPEDLWRVRPGTVDVWWQGQGYNGHLMLLLAHLLCSNPDSRARRIRIMRMLPSEVGREDTEAHLLQLTQDVRIPCEIAVVVGTDFATMVREESRDASLVLLGMADPREQESGFISHLDDLVSDMPNVLFVYSAGDMSLHA